MKTLTQITQLVLAACAIPFAVLADVVALIPHGLLSIALFLEEGGDK